MENFALSAMVENLRPAMRDLVGRRVIHHPPNGFIFQPRSARLPALKIGVEPQNPALDLSEARTPVETSGIHLQMVLRKHLTSGELVSIFKPLSERIVEFVFKTAVPTKELETMSLVVELLPNAPNIILLDAERRVLSSFLPITPQHGIGEYETYSYPKGAAKLDLQQLLERNAAELNDMGSQSNPKDWLISTVAGLGPVFAGEIIHRQRKSNRPVIE